MTWATVVGRVVSGHGVASGIANDPRFPEGTLAMQRPFFLKLGLDLDHFHGGTLNVSIKPYRYEIVQPKITFRKVKWSPDLPAEDFSFFDCRLSKMESSESVSGVVYYPHPETKPEFFQDQSTLEILAPFISRISEQSKVHLDLDERQVQVLPR
ncbi:MAG: hypothetical protein CMI30_13600 [Opitutae bacterium]|nr:hypothetical protein [Opitutae bacterium]|tara:strand:+ start:15623 stop:16084 length:462 start_codon:yes stop_codon:yes gene_type:complete